LFPLGPLAQSVEQQTFNLWVVGSIPTGPTNQCLPSVRRPIFEHYIFSHTPNSGLFNMA